MRFKFSYKRIGFAIFMYVKNHKNTVKELYYIYENPTRKNQST
jgi:hypothetical protein